MVEFKKNFGFRGFSHCFVLNQFGVTASRELSRVVATAFSSREQDELWNLTWILKTMGLQKGIFLSKYGYLEYMGVSKNRGKPPKWMVYFMENSIKMDDLGGKNHLFLVQHPYRFGNIPYPKTDSFARVASKEACHRMPRHIHKIGACKPEGDATSKPTNPSDRPTDRPVGRICGILFSADLCKKWLEVVKVGKISIIILRTHRDVSFQPWNLGGRFPIWPKYFWNGLKPSPSVLGAISNSPWSVGGFVNGPKTFQDA